MNVIEVSVWVGVIVGIIELLKMGVSALFKWATAREHGHNSAIDALSASDAAGNDLATALTTVIGGLNSNLSALTKTQDDQRRLLKYSVQTNRQVVTILADIKGDVSAVRGKSYSMETEISRIRTDQGRIERKLNIIGKALLSNEPAWKPSDKKGA